MAGAIAGSRLDSRDGEDESEIFADCGGFCNSGRFEDAEDEEEEELVPEEDELDEFLKGSPKPYLETM